MKNIKYITVILSIALLASCQKQMDIQKDDRAEGMESIYRYLTRTQSTMCSAFYTPVVSGPQSGFSAGGYMMAAYCDEAQEVYQSSSAYDWYNGRVSSSSMPLWHVEGVGGTERWSGLFNTVYTCNEALRGLQKEDLISDYTDDLRRGLVSQFYGLRAYAYLQLIKRWGGVPIMREPVGKDHDYSGDSRASFAQCVDFIIESCDAALAYTDDTKEDGLPWFAFGNTAAQQVRLGRAALWAIKSQAALYAASPLWVDDHAGTEKYTWEKAAKICKEALDQVVGHGGALVTKDTAFPNTSDFGLNAYDKFFLSSYGWSGGSWDTETIYQPYNYGTYQSQVWKYSGLPIDVGQVSAGACPTQEMVDAYEVLSTDGSKSVPLLNLANPYNADGTPNFNPDALTAEYGYEDGTAKMYENRDPRFYSTIYYDGAKIELANGEEYEVETHIGGNCALNLSPSNRRNTSTGYYLRKFSNARSGAEAGNNDGYIRVFRIAELYLNFAEAAYKAYGADHVMDATTQGDDTYGDPMSARDAVNAVRARVEMPAIADVDNAFWLRLQNERRVELAFEEHRFFDVRRWTAPAGDLAATDSRVSGIRIEDQAGSMVYSRFSYNRKCYSNKYLKYPVSLEEVRKMLSLTGDNWQNNGWN